MKKIKTSAFLPVDKSVVVFTQDNGAKEILKLCHNGDIYVRGRLIDNDLEVVEALREFLKLGKRT